MHLTKIVALFFIFAYSQSYSSWPAVQACYNKQVNDPCVYSYFAPAGTAPGRNVTCNGKCGQSKGKLRCDVDMHCKSP